MILEALRSMLDNFERGKSVSISSGSHTQVEIQAGNSCGKSSTTMGPLAGNEPSPL